MKVWDFVPCWAAPGSRKVPASRFHLPQWTSGDASPGDRAGGLPSIEPRRDTVTIIDVVDAPVEYSMPGFGGAEHGQGLLSLLREASLTIDAMWRSALQDGSADMAHRLGEASHAVHRALIALVPS